MMKINRATFIEASRGVVSDSWVSCCHWLFKLFLSQSYSQPQTTPHAVSILRANLNVVSELCLQSG